jgi:hypothetical protein
MPHENGRRRLVLVLRLLALTLPAYFAWEMLQAPAFTGMPKGWLQATAVCGVATLGDGVVVLGLFGLGWFMFRDFRWFVPPRVSRLTTRAGPWKRAGISARSRTSHGCSRARIDTDAK